MQLCVIVCLYNYIKYTQFLYVKKIQNFQPFSRKCKFSQIFQLREQTVKCFLKAPLSQGERHLTKQYSVTSGTQLCLLT